MSKLVCVPVEPTDEMTACGYAAMDCPSSGDAAVCWSAMLAARPPLPGDIEAALELAKIEYRCDPTGLSRISALARALLKCCGRDA